MITTLQHYNRGNSEMSCVPGINSSQTFPGDGERIELITTLITQELRESLITDQSEDLVRRHVGLSD